MRFGFKLGGSGALRLLRSAWRGRMGAVGADEEPTLSAGDREKMLRVISLGCPRSTAAKFIGLCEEPLESLIERDVKLLREVLQAEAQAEVRHMGNVHKASQDEKNWRTSVWWLEARGIGVIDEASVETGVPETVLVVLEKFAELIVAEIPDVFRRQALLDKLLHIAVESVEPPFVIEAGEGTNHGGTEGTEKTNAGRLTADERG